MHENASCAVARDERVAAYSCHTSKSRSGLREKAGNDWMQVGGPNPPKENDVGQVLR